MASRFTSVTLRRNHSLIVNDEAVPENTKKATKFGLVVFEGNGLTLSRPRGPLMGKIV